MLRFIKKNAGFIIIGLVLVAVISVALIAGGSDTKSGPITSACGPYRADKVIRISGSDINAEVVSAPKDLSKGLSGRPCILPDQGMLFVFRQSGQHPFWMKNMKFPIDIIWISADHKAAGIERDVKPSTYPDGFVNKKENPALYVLELKANRSSELHIELGTPVSF